MSYWGGTAIGAVTVDGTSKNTTHQIYSNSSDESDGNGHGKFEYAPPSGFLAICTKNLAKTG